MIASVRGTVLAVRLDSAVVEVGGVGMLVQATPATLAQLRHGQEALLHTSLVVREDSLTLFGFAEDDEREAFEIVQTVSGVGPRLALAMLAVHTPDGLRRAVAGEDLKALERVPGIGRKGAQRIVLELKDRLGAPSAVPVAGAAAAAPTPTETDRRQQVVDALVGLGWNPKVAEEAVTDVLADTEGPLTAEDVPAVLRAALRGLGGVRG
ncbi:ATP-dependent DNA helicase RuvA [Cellulomonas sp. A375-1]|uniref:Holliday junction branch migration complex subunit RuvA n=1 Tax=Cellulomonas gelida TaxID=1712 RepID=A0A4Y3KKU2_9CELL|nr:MULTISPECIES: Holliday junction branch migration protein RuvA [Cellulomonas]KMM45324.1 ATP-dependent DNA helicase RuvA [Cellulomonas sp. A375-1]MCR6703543.1 Holliday junction branch migration protein RuvA [Cellulomonas sp.]GEA84266.1 Holliday junction ATP-dependent DNA helicase RuvA [Cellulomonas gelida]GGL36608.1 Holliday junction ATP-dependent DNA helicase RuvA [Cellulomonas gelida]